MVYHMNTALRVSRFLRKILEQGILVSQASVPALTTYYGGD